MEYALEGYGFSAARMLRNLFTQRRNPGGAPLDDMDDLFEGMLETDYQRYGDHFAETLLKGLAVDRPELHHPPELLSTLRAQGHSGPLQGLALRTVSATKAAFDALRQSVEVRLTVCSLDSDSQGGEHLRLGVYLPGLVEEVRAHDEVTAGVMVALHGQPGGGCRLEVVPRMYRKICENGLIVSLGDVFGRELDVQHLLASQEEAPLAHALSEAIHSCLSETVFQLAVASFQRSAHEPLEDARRAESLVGGLSPEVRHAVLRRYRLEGDLTLWGLVNAITAEARGAPGALALSLERMGAELTWQAMAPGEHVADSSSRRFAKKRSAA